MKDAARANSRHDGAALYSMYARKEVQRRGSRIDFSLVEEILHMEAAVCLFNSNVNQ